MEKGLLSTMKNTETIQHARAWIPWRRSWMLAVAPLAIWAGMTGPASAQEPERGVPVEERPRPDYDAIGIPAGAFLVFPSVELGWRYDDNIFRKKDDKTEDRILSFQPAVRAASQWSNHQLVLDAAATASFYSSFTDENKVDWLANLGGRVDVTRDTKLEAALNVYDLTEEPDTPTAATVGTPGDLRLLGGSIGASHRLNRLTVAAEGRVTDLSYDEFEKKTLDRLEVELSGQVGYQILPEFEPLVRVTAFQRDYDREPMGEEGRFDRDSDGWELVAGTELDLGGLIAGEIVAGWRRQDYRGAMLPAISKPTLGLSLQWNVTPLTTISANVARRIVETEARASGVLSTSSGIGVNHELRRNLTLSAEVGLINEAYEVVAGAPDLEEDLLSVGLGGIWLVDRNTQIEFGYLFQKKDSTVPTDVFEANVVSLSLRLQI